MKFLLVTLLAAAASASFAPLYTVMKKIDGSYIVVLNDGESLTVAVKTLRDSPFFSLVLGGRIERVYGSVLNGFSATLNEKALEFIRSMDIVKYVAEDGLARASQVTSWGLDRIDQRNLPLDNTYNPPRHGTNVTVYVIDTGIRHTHIDFGGRVEFGFDYEGGSGEDHNGHGTHCAGTIGGNSFGVASDVVLRNVRVLSCNGIGTVSRLIDGVNYVKDDCGGLCVASMSLDADTSVPLNSAVANLVASGVPAVVAAGNENADACNYSPASETSAITVGSADDGDWRSSFSNWGECLDIFAPGYLISSTWHDSDVGSVRFSGTSMACSHVAGKCRSSSSRERCQCR
ncbi:Proteinase R [Holothuria leucospilota]|uniref:Proteinase R n=1 Tax=Holothuria leucospilota TaxID=206669 RepID=A0A9Q1BRQ0_HOLLE|nr:Proteinase R [Holothuria leucospilota]